MAKLNTWYEQTKHRQSQPELLYQIDIRGPNGNRITLTMASHMNSMDVSGDFGDAEKWIHVEKIGKIEDEKIRIGKPFVIKEIFDIMES